MPWSIDDILKVVQIISYGVALPSAVAGILWHFYELNDKRTWEKAKLARDMVAALEKSEKALAATYMLGRFEARKYKIANDHWWTRSREIEVTITQQEVRDALSLSPTSQELSSKQEYIRECFDTFLFNLEQWILASKQGLVEYSQLRPLVLTFLAGIESCTGCVLKQYARSLNYHEAASGLDDLISGALKRS